MNAPTFSLYDPAISDFTQSTHRSFDSRPFLGVKCLFLGDDLHSLLLFKSVTRSPMGCKYTSIYLTLVDERSLGETDVC